MSYFLSFGMSSGFLEFLFWLHILLQHVCVVDLLVLFVLYVEKYVNDLDIARNTDIGSSIL